MIIYRLKRFENKDKDLRAARQTVYQSARAQYEKQSSRDMVATQSHSEQQMTARLDNSRRGVLIVGTMLVLVAVVVLGLWLQVVPPAPAPVEKYLPLPNGASLVYRISNADGTVHYRSRNVRRVPAPQLIHDIQASVFTALMQAAGIDLEQVTTSEALRRLGTFEIAELTDVEYDAGGKTLNRSTQLVLVTPERVNIFAVDGVGITPALPLIVTASATENITGTLNAQVPFAFSFEQQPIAGVTTALGELRDCMRVRTVLDINQNKTTSRTTYCAGSGEVLDETSDSGAPNLKRAEVVAASVGSFLKGSAPFVEPTVISATVQNAFPERIGTALRQAFAYKERQNSNGITTQIVPANDVLLYGTASGAVVALERATLRERWRFQTGGAVYSTPTVANGSVYFGSADKKVYAVRFDDGAFEWAFSAHDVVSVTPAAGPDTVFVASEDKRVYALDKDTGKARWTFSSGSPFVASPALDGNTLYVSNASGALTALDAVTGQVRWRFGAERAITAPVTVSGEHVLVTSNDYTVSALQRADGNVVWQTDLNDSIETQPIVANGRVIVALQDQLVALDAATGNVVWHYQDTNSLRGAPIVTGDQIWQLTLYELIGVDAKTGTRFLKMRAADSSPTSGLSSDGRMLYAGFFAGDLVGFESAP